MATRLLKTLSCANPSDGFSSDTVQPFGSGYDPHLAANHRAHSSQLSLPLEEESLLLFHKQN
jgi:hypothetical protein